METNMSDFEIPFPDASDPKEIYAFFGLAMYHAQVFEKGYFDKRPFMEHL